MNNTETRAYYLINQSINMVSCADVEIAALSTYFSFNVATRSICKGV